MAHQKILRAHFYVKMTLRSVDDVITVGKFYVCVQYCRYTFGSTLQFRINEGGSGKIINGGCINQLNIDKYGLFKGSFYQNHKKNRLNLEIFQKVLRGDRTIFQKLIIGGQN